MKYLLILLTCTELISARAQEYKVVSGQADDFSTVLVELLNEAPQRFEKFKGKFLRTTPLSHNEFELSIEVPGSAAAIIRERDGLADLYAEFRGFANEEELKRGVLNLRRKIITSLDGNVRVSPRDTADLWKGFTGFSISDEAGYFGMNLEIFAGSSASPAYLHGPWREEGSGVKTHFILMKVYGGLPFYFYFIKPVSPPVLPLHRALTIILQQARADFDSLRMSDTLLKEKRTQQIRVHGYEVILNCRGANYHAQFHFKGGEEERLDIETAVQAAVGASFAYHRYLSGDREAVVYFSSTDVNAPRVYLREKEDGKLVLEIQSPVEHATKRYLEQD